MKCSIKGCKNDTRRANLKSVDGITFHLFPVDETIRNQWVQLVNREGWLPTNYSKVCSSHFKEEDMFATKKGFRKIRLGALPCCNLGTRACETPTALNSKRRHHASSTAADGITRTSLEKGCSRGTLRLAPGAGEGEVLNAPVTEDLLAELRRLSDKIQSLYPATRGKHFTLAFRGENGDKCEYIFTSASETRRAGARHNGLGCNECGAGIAGFRYKCVACADYDLCGACEALGAHAHHVVMRIATPLRFKHARTLVQRWCDALRAAGLGSPGEMLGEPPPPSRAPTAFAASDALRACVGDREFSTVQCKISETSEVVKTEEKFLTETEIPIDTHSESSMNLNHSTIPTKTEKPTRLHSSMENFFGSKTSDMYTALAEPTLTVEEVKVEEPDPLLDQGEEWRDPTRLLHRAGAGAAPPSISAHAGNIVIDPTLHSFHPSGRA